MAVHLYNSFLVAKEKEKKRKKGARSSNDDMSWGSATSLLRMINDKHKVFHFLWFAFLFYCSHFLYSSIVNHQLPGFLFCGICQTFGEGPSSHITKQKSSKDRYVGVVVLLFVRELPLFLANDVKFQFQNQSGWTEVYMLWFYYLSKNHWFCFPLFVREIL